MKTPLFLIPAVSMQIAVAQYMEQPRQLSAVRGLQSMPMAAAKAEKEAKEPSVKSESTAKAEKVIGDAKAEKVPGAKSAKLFKSKTKSAKGESESAKSGKGEGIEPKEKMEGKAAKSNGSSINVPLSPPLPGVSNSGPTPKVILAQDTDYPPFTGIGPNLELTGFGPDFARGIEEVCNIDVTLVETRWSQCWGSNEIGEGLLAGHYHGCTAYTGTKGVRQRYLEFSAPILEDNKAAGILTRLINGVPFVNGESSLDGLNVGDVVGWAPTADVLATSMNQCTGETFSGFTLVPNTPGENNANDFALKQLLSGETDALWIYADQAAKFNAECAIDSDQEWDCERWGKLGEDFAYVQTGIYDYAESGTTLAISKKGSGLADTLNPCIEAFIKTESYKNLCVKYELENDCFTNEFFDETSNSEVQPYSLPTSDLTTSCDDGYCPCPSSRRGL